MKRRVAKGLLTVALLGVFACLPFKYSVLAQGAGAQAIKTPSIAVFPLKNATGSQELDWLSIGLQDSLTVDLWYMSGLHTIPLPEFTQAIKERCLQMELHCPAGLDEDVWKALAAGAGLDLFLWGSYRVEGKDIVARMRLYEGPTWTAGAEMIIVAPVAGLLSASSRELLSLVENRGIVVKPEESKRALSAKTPSVSAWKQNALGFWLQQEYSAAAGEERPKIAVQWDAALKKAVEEDTAYAEAWNNLGWQKVTAEDWDGALEAFRKALGLKPGMIDANIGLGHSLAASKNLESALPYLERGVELNPSLSVHYRILIGAYFGAERWQDGLARTSSLIAYLSERGRENEGMELVSVSSSIHEKLEQWDEAIQGWQTLEKHYADHGDSSNREDVLRRIDEIAELYFTKARTLHEQRQYESALIFYEKAKAIFGKYHPDLVAYLLHDMADCYKALHRIKQAESAYRESLALKEQVLGAEDPQVAFTLNDLAFLYESLGDYSKAKSLYERALAIREKAHGSEHPGVAISLGNLAGLYRALGDYGQAKPLYERALAIVEKVQGPEHPGVAISLGNLAELYRALGDYSQAKPLYERSLAIMEKARGSEHPDVATSLNNMGCLYHTLGDYGQAKPLFERALAIREKAYGSEHPDVAVSLSNLASLYHILGDYGQAKLLFERAMAIMEKVQGSEHPNVAISLNNLAELYHALGDYNLAKPLFERALAIKEKVYGSEHPSVANSLNNLALLYHTLGDYTKAKLLFERALAIRERVHGSDHPDVAASLGNLAGLYDFLGDYSKAKPLYERALAIADRAGQPELLWRVLGNLSLLLARQSNPNAAIFFGKQSVNVIQKLRAGISGMEKELQKSFLARKEGIYKHLANLLIDQGRLPEAQQALQMLKEEELFDYVRRDAKREDVRSTEASYTDEERPWAERGREMGGRLVAMGKEMSELQRKKKGLGLSAEEEVRRQQLDEELKKAHSAYLAYLADLMDALGRSSKERYAEVVAKRLDKPRKLQQALQELGHGAVAIHYLMTEEKLRIIVTTPEIQLARDYAISEKELNHKIFAYRETLQSPSRSPFPQALELYRIVLEPIAEDLRQAQAQTLMLSLDGTLRYLPVSALHDGEAYVAEKYRLAIYTLAAEMDVKDRPSAGWRAAGLGLSRAVGDLPPLPAVPAELRGIVKQDGSASEGALPGVVYLDDDFTERAMRDALESKDYPVLHIASHFVLRPGTEKDSHLVLGDGSPLTIARVKEENMDFTGVELLTLSACNTAMSGARANGSEIESFGALAQDQGAKGVLATLWPVVDKSTGIFMQGLYRIHEEQRGMTKAEALHQAQILFIRGRSASAGLSSRRSSDTTPKSSTSEAADDARGEPITLGEDGKENEDAVKSRFTPDPEAPYAHPHYWAPFILMGNWL